MDSWYKKFSQTITVDPAILQQLSHGIQQTFNLMDFGRVHFRYLNSTTDRNNRTMLTFRSTPDPTLPEYFVRIRLDIPNSVAEVIVMKDQQPLPMESVPLNFENVKQTPYQIAEAVKRAISYTASIQGR